MSQFNLSINGVVMNVIETQGLNQPLSAAHAPQPYPKSVSAEQRAGSLAVADVKVSNVVVQDAISNRA